MDFFLYFSLYTVTGFSVFLYLFASFQRNTAPAYTSGRCCRMQETLPLSAFARHMQAAHKSHIPTRRKAPMPPEASHPFWKPSPRVLDPFPPEDILPFRSDSDILHRYHRHCLSAQSSADHGTFFRYTPPYCCRMHRCSHSPETAAHTADGEP